MTKGLALTWAATFHENAVDATRTITLGTYSNFIAKFNKDFKQRDVTGATIAWLTTKQMVLKKDQMYSPPLNQYISEFQNHVTWASIKDPNILIRYFLLQFSFSILIFFYSLHSLFIVLGVLSISSPLTFFLLWDLTLFSCDHSNTSDDVTTDVMFDNVP